MHEVSTFLRVYSEPPHQADSESTSNSSSGHSSSVALCTSALAVGFACFALAVANGVEIAFWFQPTCVGLLWASLFMTGFALGSVGRGRLFAATLALAFSAVANTALQRITDIGANDCILIAACLLVAGWLAARSLAVRPPPRCDDDNVSDAWWNLTRTKSTPLSPLRGDRLRVRGFGTCGRMSIWDIGFVTLIVACFCHAIPNLSTTPTLLVGVLVSLLGCLLTSWVASRWALTDQWSIWTIAVLAAGFAASTGWVIWVSPDNTTLVQALTWAVIGPLNVIATQATAVLLLLVIARWESRVA